MENSIFQPSTENIKSNLLVYSVQVDGFPADPELEEGTKEDDTKKLVDKIQDTFIHMEAITKKLNQSKIQLPNIHPP